MQHPIKNLKSLMPVQSLVGEGCAENLSLSIPRNENRKDHNLSLKKYKRCINKSICHYYN